MSRECRHVTVGTGTLAALPKLWTDTVEGHRREVRQAILETTAAIAARQGLLSVTMSQIAQEAGIGRATLYKYFPDVEAIVLAWHDDQITRHLGHLAELRDGGGDPAERLHAMLVAYALLSRQSAGHHHELGAFLHRDDRLTSARQRLLDLIRDVVAEGAEAGAFRDDVSPSELASFCVHAMSAAGTLPSKAAVRRLVTVTLAGLRPGGADAP